MTNKEILEAAANNAAYIVKLETEIDQLKKVLHLTPNECLAGGFCRGLALREDIIDLDEIDRKILETAGRCIGRIINQKEAEK